MSRPISSTSDSVVEKLVTNRQSDQRFQDFLANTPESTHMSTFLFSPWGIPANYRMMQGSGVNTYKWVNAQGEAVLVKYHFEPKVGIKNLTQEEANKVQSTNFNHAQDGLNRISGSRRLANPRK